MRLMRSKIESLYFDVYHRALVGRWLNSITGHRRHLRSLAEALHGRVIRERHSEGLQCVDLDRITGSEGRWQDFDPQFRPLRTHTCERWFRIAQAQLLGEGLPPVELLRIGEEYCVRDGNHRVSVARVCGQRSIEAIVTHYVLAPQPSPEQPTGGMAGEARLSLGSAC